MRQLTKTNIAIKKQLANMFFKKGEYKQIWQIKKKKQNQWTLM